MLPAFQEQINIKPPFLPPLKGVNFPAWRFYGRKRERERGDNYSLFFTSVPLCSRSGFFYFPPSSTKALYPLPPHQNSLNLMGIACCCFHEVKKEQRCGLGENIVLQAPTHLNFWVSIDQYTRAGKEIEHPLTNGNVVSTYLPIELLSLASRHRVTWIKAKRGGCAKSGRSGALKPGAFGISYKANKCSDAGTGDFTMQLTPQKTSSTRSVMPCVNAATSPIKYKPPTHSTETELRSKGTHQGLHHKHQPEYIGS